MIAVRRRTAAVIVLTSVAAASTIAVVALAGQPAAHAHATFINTAGTTIGWARLVEDASGRMHVNVQVDGLSTGLHGIHIHTTGLCDTPSFVTAGGHYNPSGAQHGLDSTDGPHAGDLPNLSANEAGRGHLDAVTERVTVAALVAGDGSALIIHAAEDDQVTNPTGNSGARIACGVIVAG